jgi:hypothetical protein
MITPIVTSGRRRLFRRLGFSKGHFLSAVGLPGPQRRNKRGSAIVSPVAGERRRVLAEIRAVRSKGGSK